MIYSLAFAFGAGITTLLFAHRKNFRVLAAFTLPLAALILTLARFIGNEFIDLPPVLDSYWRPIHVGDAILSYGVALVCFGVAVMYLLKDGVKVEAMAIWSSIFGISVIATISKFSVFTEFVYRAGLFVPKTRAKKPFSAPFRLEIPYVGPALVIAGLLLLGIVIAYSALPLSRITSKRKDCRHYLAKARHSSLRSFRSSSCQRHQDNDGCLPQSSGPACATIRANIVAGMAMAENQQHTVQELSAMTAEAIRTDGQAYVQQNGNKMFLSLKTNPVEFAALLTALVGTLFVIIFRSEPKNCGTFAEPRISRQPDVQNCLPRLRRTCNPAYHRSDLGKRIVGTALGI